MEDAYILCNVIETFWWRKVTKVERWGPFAPFKFQMALAQLCKNTLACLCKQPNTSIAKEMNWFVVCWLRELISLVWTTSEAANPWVAQYQESKYAWIGLVMTTLVKVLMPSLVSTMLICQWKELNVVEGSACNCSCLTWKLTFCIMVAKVSQIISWVLVRSLPWTQCKKWIPIRSMGCVHTHQGMFAIEGWGSPSRIQSVVKKNGEIKRLGKLVKL